MEDENGQGPDASSIRPVSSLRSRFENLGKDQDTPPASSFGPRQASFTSKGPTDGQKPGHGIGGTGVAGLASGFGNMRSVSPSGLNTAPTGGAGRDSSAPAMPIPRRPRPGPPISRPSSVVSMASSPLSPPQVTVDSPRSPQRTPAPGEARTLGSVPPLQPLTSNGNDSPTGSHARTPSRATTPALEARMAAFLHDTEPSKPGATHVEATTSSSETNVKPKTTAPGAPPVVNRAAKPKVPVKPTTLVSRSSTLAAPEVAAELTDQSVSPFSTPPSSPDPKIPIATQGPQAPPRPRNESDASFVERSRTDSDASWVQRIRTDSDPSFVERARAGSTASFVEPSHLPDDWLPPPLHHAVAAKREQQVNGISKAPLMSMRVNMTPSRSSLDLEDISEERPRLPARPELQVRSGRTSPTKPRSGRTSPTKFYAPPPRRSTDSPIRSSANVEVVPPRQFPASKPVYKSALSQGFDRSSSPSRPPTIPAPRRSTDRRRDMTPPAAIPASVVAESGSKDTEDEGVAPLESGNERARGPTDFPDATQANRRPPRYKQRPWQIPTGYDTRLLAVCGEQVCTSGYITKAWNMRTGEQLLNMDHREGVKVLSIVFKPMNDMQDEGNRIWLGTSIGEIHEIDIPLQCMVDTTPNAHTRREVIRLYRYSHEIWSLDDSGELHVWKPDKTGAPNLSSPSATFRVPRGHSFSIACGMQLWIASGKDIRVFLPGARSDAEFQATRSPLTQPGTGDVTSGAMINGKQNLVYFGHSDGKVSVYDRNDLSCTAVVNVSLYRISSLVGVADRLWAGYSTGMTYVYDTSTTPWTVQKDWQAHEKQVSAIIADPSAIWTMGRLNVVTLSTDNTIRIWDGMLEDDLLEAHMRSHDSDYCSFREMTAAVMTWNAGASKPSFLQQNREDNNFFRDYLTNGSAPDILVFGFQELVDLEDKKLTAKSLFKSKKKDSNEQEHMSHQYRAWRDHLTRCVDEHMPVDEPYTLLHTASLVGLFSCVFVKSSERPRIKHVHASEVKRGMGGRYGNKGALILRMILDDSSICFINCHLAAGQTQTMNRNNDVAAILEASTLPSYPLNESEGAQHNDVFAAGGDGSMILDHEICILNGDLNYRIDTMGRDIVVKQVLQGNFTKLLERDQLLLSRRKNPGFRLRAFQESKITFAPTYKYNVHSDDYDTSEKRRAPAWCDRILYRGIGRVKMEEYRRWDQIRVSDHRPVSGRLRLRVKTVDTVKRERVWQQCLRELDVVKRRVTQAAQLEYLTNVLGMPYDESLAAVQAR